MCPIDSQTIENLARAHQKEAVTESHLPFHNFRDLLSLHAKTSPGKTYLIHYDADGQRDSLSYRQVVARVHQIANFMVEDLGIKRGDRVASLAYNHSDTVLLYFACWVIGATIAPLNVAEDNARLAFILKNSEAKAFFVRGEYIDRVEEILNIEGEHQPDQIEVLIQIGGESDSRFVQFHEALKGRPTTFLADGVGAKSADLAIYAGNEATASLYDEALLVYTSGTTGAPKGVVLTQYNLLVDALAISQWQAITGNQRMMCVLPIHHVNGIVVTLITPLLVGASTVLNRQFSVSHFWERVVKEEVHIVSVVPTLLQFLLEYGRDQLAAGNTIFGHNINRSDLSHFRHFICGAGTLALSLVRDFEDTFGLTILHGYGLSETTCYSCFLPFHLSWEEHQHWMLDYEYPSIGCPIQANEMAIFSADGSGQRLGEGERGEICIRGDNVMKHYFKRDDANAETFKFGWFRSGDEGFYKTDAQGRPFFFITGRLKELINRGGVKFSPFDIEEVLLEIKGVKVALAVAFENDYYGEEVGAYIVPESGVTLDEAGILAHCRERLNFEKSPKVIVFGTEIPITSTGKYQRLKLRPLFGEWKSTQFRK